MPEIKAVVFDLGGVVVYDATPEIILEALKVFGGRMSMRSMLSGLRTKLFQYSKIFYENIESLQRSEIDELTFWRNVLRLPPGSITSKEAQEVFEKPYRKHFRVNRRTLAIVDELRKAGYRVIALTNTIPIHLNITKAAIGGHFDSIVASCSEGLSKPQREIYLRAAERAGAKPEECIFIDDRTRYVEGARAAGLPALLFKGAPQLRKELAEKGLRIKPPLQPFRRLRRFALACKLKSQIPRLRK